MPISFGANFFRFSGEEAIGVQSQNGWLCLCSFAKEGLLLNCSNEWTVAKNRRNEASMTSHYFLSDTFGNPKPYFEIYGKLKILATSDLPTTFTYETYRNTIR